MAQPKERVFGRPPEEMSYVRVRIQHMTDGRVVKTQSFAVYRADADQVEEAVRQTLEREFSGRPKLRVKKRA